jgi:hypothetical protein
MRRQSIPIRLLKNHISGSIFRSAIAATIILFFLISTSASAQNVGVGTSTPAYGKLEILASGGNTLVARTTTTGPGISFLNPAGSPTIGFNTLSTGSYSFLGAGYGSFLQYTPADGRLKYYSSVAAGTANTAMGSTTAYQLSINPNGNVGIGSIDPQYKLDIDGRMRIQHAGASAGIWLNKTDNTEGTFFGQYDDNTVGFWGPGTSSVWRFGFNLPNARFGINQMVPLEGLHISNRNVRMDDASGNQSIMMSPNGFSNAGSIVLYEDGGNANISIRASDAVNSSGEIIFTKPGVSGTMLELDGDYASSGRSRIIVDEIQIKGGADFAEYFDITEDGYTAEAGMLVSIDEKNAGQLTISKTAYDKKVAGVISGANGVKAGVMMGHRSTIADGKHPIAISGRVYVKAIALNTDIKPGDLITTSHVPGYAMLAMNVKKSRGAIIGKAMSSLKAGSTGYLLVLLSVQ